MSSRALRSLRGASLPLLAVLGAASALAAGTAWGQGGGSATGDRPDCVFADGHARYTGFGYQHTVHVENRCTFAVDCHVSTDVSPEVHDVHLAPNGSTDVATFLSSPAAVFVANVVCPYEHHREPVISDPGE